jgi:hypothetical protein
LAREEALALALMQARITDQDFAGIILPVNWDETCGSNAGCPASD